MRRVTYQDLATCHTEQQFLKYKNLHLMLLVYNKKIQLQFKKLLRKRKINVDSKQEYKFGHPDITFHEILCHAQCLMKSRET